jgi:hypothetical protein
MPEIEVPVVDQSPVPPQDRLDTATLPDLTNTNPEDWQSYPEDRRPPLPMLTKWLRLYRYHMPFLRDIRKKDGKEISAETIAEFTALVHEMLEVGTQLNIKVMTASLLPNVEEEIQRQELYKVRHRELTSAVNTDTERAYQQLQAKAEDLARESRARAARIRELFQS